MEFSLESLGETVGFFREGDFFKSFALFLRVIELDFDLLALVLLFNYVSLAGYGDLPLVGVFYLFLLALIFVDA